MCRVRSTAHTHVMTTSTTETSLVHLAAVERLYAAFAGGDMAGVLAELSDDVEWAAEASGPNVPWYGPHHGKREVPRFFEAIASSVDISEFDVVGMASSATDVVATVHWTFTVRSTGRTASMYMQHWWRFADGRISWFRGSEDSAQTVAAFRED